MQLGEVNMDFEYADYFGVTPSTGYERLLHDCMTGDATLFQRADMVEAGMEHRQSRARCVEGAAAAQFPQLSRRNLGPERIRRTDGARRTALEKFREVKNFVIFFLCWILWLTKLPITTRSIEVLATAADLFHAAAEEFVRAARTAIGAQGRFTVALGRLDSSKLSIPCSPSTIATSPGTASFYSSATSVTFRPPTRKQLPHGARIVACQDCDPRRECLSRAGGKSRCQRRCP
jgi:hypothetical protein